MDETQTTAAIILAAGSSSRMGAGRHKLLLPLAGRPVLVHVVDATLASQARPIIIVLGHQAKEVRAHLALYVEYPHITIVENPDYQQGMSTCRPFCVRWSQCWWPIRVESTVRSC